MTRSFFPTNGWRLCRGLIPRKSRRRRPLMKKYPQPTERSLHPSCLGVRDSRKCCLGATLGVCIPTDMEERKYAMLEQAKHVLVAGIVSRSIGTGFPGVVGNLKADPKNYKCAIIGPNTIGWILRMAEESKLTIDHDAT